MGIPLGLIKASQRAVRSLGGLQPNARIARSVIPSRSTIAMGGSEFSRGATQMGAYATPGASTRLIPSATMAAKATAATYTHTAPSMSGVAGSAMDSVARGMFTVATAPFAMAAYPIFKAAGATLKGAWGATKMAGRGTVGYAKYLSGKGVGGTRRAWYVGAAAAGFAGIGIQYKLGQHVNRKMRERDRTTMGLGQALHRIHG